MCAILVLASIAASSVHAQTLGAVLAERGVAAPAGVLDLDREITSWAVLDDEDVFVIAYYHRGPDNGLPDSLRIRVLDRRAMQWRHAAIARDIALPGSVAGAAIGSATRVTATAGHLYIDSHITPSAGTVLMLTRSLEPVATLYGWTQTLLPDGAVIFQHSMPHFAPTHSAELWLYDANVGQRRIYPVPPHGSVRTAYIADVATRYRELGEAWFRDNNHHMDPERFDSSIIGPIASDAAGDAIAFIAQFGGGAANAAATPAVDVVVHCTSIRSAPTCTDVRLEAMRAQNPGLADNDLLVLRLGGRDRNIEQDA